ncbi:MAG: hypothetical protein ACTIB2_03015 [Brachybacterium tyrofermentans]
MSDQPHSDQPHSEQPHRAPFRPFPRPVLSRRALLAGSAASVAGTALATAPAQLAFAEDAGLVAAGTTLEEVAVAGPGADGTYRRLVAGPGYAFQVREDALDTSPKASRADTRAPLAAFVQFTDLHVLDAQSPMRFEFLHDITGSAFRPQESLTTQGAVSLVERVNELGAGPHTGRALDCVVTTGDSTDNHEQVELDWFLAVMSGGEITANTGASDVWEGVQTSGSSHYWNPAGEQTDRYAEAGFPQLPELLHDAMAEHRSPGLDCRWYSVFGNHDDSISGTLPSDWHGLVDMYTGSWKFTGFADPAADRRLEQRFAPRPTPPRRARPRRSTAPRRRRRTTRSRPTRAGRRSPRRTTSAPTSPRPRGWGPRGTASPRPTPRRARATTPSRSPRA